MKRVILLVLDSLGIGAAADAGNYHGKDFTDEGANTLGHIAEFFAQGGADNDRHGPLRLPHLAALGLGQACAASCGVLPPGLEAPSSLTGGYAWAREVSAGKDTPSGHWELTGVPVPFAWSYFPDRPDCFPPDLLTAIREATGVRSSLGNCHASGTEIIARLGEDHLRSGEPIFYTSADSVFQVACHEEHFGLEPLYELCRRIRTVLDGSERKLGRVIARPFVGSDASSFQRTGNRRDYAVPPPAPTVLQRLVEAGGTVIGIGKIGDIFAHTGMSEEIRASGHPALWEATFEAIERAGDRSLVMTNFVDFDAVFGHRRDPRGYGLALEEFDAMLPQLSSRLREGDLLILTADHGNDPTWPGTDHTREHVPILLHGAAIPPGTDYGRRETFADVGQTVAHYLQLPPLPHGRSLLTSAHSHAHPAP